MDKLSGIDAGFWYLHGKNSPMYLGVVLRVEPKIGGTGISVEELVELFAARRGRLADLTKKVWTPRFGIGFPHWVEDDEFDFASHIVTESEPFDQADELDVIVADFFVTHLDKDRPPWQIQLCYDHDGNTFILVKLHHALLDGGLGLEILAAVVDLEANPDPDELSVPSKQAATKILSPIDSALESIIDLVNGRIPAFLNLKRRFSDQRKEPEGYLGAALGSLFAGTRCEISGALSDQREFRSLSLPLAVLSAHASRTNSTINNALLSIIAGAMNRYFEDRGLDPIETLLALVPISLRGQSKEGEIPSSKNRLTGMLVSLPTSAQSPLERLEMTTRAVVESRAVVDSLGAEVLFEFGSFVATPLISMAVDLASDLSLFDSIKPLFNLVVSNLSGVNFPLYLLGRRISSIIPVGPLAEGSGLNITAYSYLDKMEVGLLSCPRLVKDPDLLVASINAELDEVERIQVTV